jgi:hypothetical protein
MFLSSRESEAVTRWTALAVFAWACGGDGSSYDDTPDTDVPTEVQDVSTQPEAKERRSPLCPGEDEPECSRSRSVMAFHSRSVMGARVG